MLSIDLRIDRAQRLLRLIEEDEPLLAVRLAPLSAEGQKSAKSYVQRLVERTQAEIEELQEQKNLSGTAEHNPSAAD
jgi:hypothetical protein